MKRTFVIKDAEPAPRPSWWKARAALTLLFAVAADGLQWLIPFLWPVFDGGMVLATLILWGWRWEVLIAVIPELIPGLELAPTWTLFAAYLLASSNRNAPPREPRQVNPPSHDPQKTAGL